MHYINSSIMITYHFDSYQSIHIDPMAL